MPTANANTGNGFSKAVSYVLQERKKDVTEQTRMQVIEQNNVYGLNSKEIGKQMREIAQERETAKKPVLHLQINFHPDEKLNTQQAQKAIDSILKDIGIEKENHQYLVVNHKDKAHNHYHVIANRVGMDGELMNDHRIKDRLQAACDKVEKEQGLRSTEGRTVLYDPSQEKGFRYATTEEKEDYAASKSRNKKKAVISDKNEKIAYVKSRIQARINRVLSDTSVTTPDQFRKRMEAENIDVKFAMQTNGISGVSFKSDDISIKGSAIDAKWRRIDGDLTTNCILNMEKDLRAYVEVKSLKNAFAVNVVDQTIREKMIEIKADDNPWATWEKNPNHEKLYQKLYDYSEKLIAHQKQKATFELSQEQNELKQEERRTKRGR